MLFGQVKELSAKDDFVRAISKEKTGFSGVYTGTKAAALCRQRMFVQRQLPYMIDIHIVYACVMTDEYRFKTVFRVQDHGSHVALDRENILHNIHRRLLRPEQRVLREACGRVGQKIVNR